MAEMKRTVLIVERLRDPGQAAKVEALVRQVKGIAEAKVQLPRMVHVTYDSGLLSPQRIMTLIGNLGIKTAEST
ncbi:MAG: hypothetical protein ACOX8W_07530 [bacterium]|jgi:copper chaperone CopZ